MHGHVRALMCLDKGAVTLGDARRDYVNIVAATDESRGEALRELGRPIHVGSERVTANHDGEWLRSRRLSARRCGSHVVFCPFPCRELGVNRQVMSRQV